MVQDVNKLLTVNQPRYTVNHVKTPFQAVAALDRHLLAPARLAILAALARGSVDFPLLVAAVGLNKGNVWHYIDDLRQAGLIEIGRRDDGRRVHTAVRLTPRGHDALADLWATLDDARTGEITADAGRSAASRMARQQRVRHDTLPSPQRVRYHASPLREENV